MACFSHTVVMKNEGACGEDDDICSSEESTIDNDVTGTNAAQRNEQVDVYRLVFILYSCLLSAAA